MKSVRSGQDTRHKAVWGSRAVPQPGHTRSKVTWGARITALTLSFSCALAVAATASAEGRRFPKMNRDLERRAVAGSSLRKSTVIVTLQDGADLPAGLQKYSRFGRLNAVGAHVLDIPDSELANVASLSQTVHVDPDRVVRGLDFRTNVTSGSFFVNHNYALNGNGVTVAVLDSGIARAHDDFSGAKVRFFKDFVNNKKTAYDDYGHGTHVSGIIAGTGHGTDGREMGVAPGAQLVVLKVLDSQGDGTVANVVAALDWLAIYGPTYKIRVVNLSFGARPSEQPENDPLALAAKKLVDRGVVVVAAAGNNGELDGKKLWGGIASPADAPWVITVGASSSLGTYSRKDDQLANFSSRGPAVGHIAKPDILASGVGIVAPVSREGTLESSKSNLLVTVKCVVFSCASTTDFMSLSGTSMAAPVVTGTVALMLQANPNLTPNLVKAILEYTAEVHSKYSPLEQGAGFLNSLGAVRLAKFFTTGLPGSRAPFSPAWSRHVYWGNHRLTGGIIQPNASAWKNGVVWGQASSTNIVWGTAWGSDNIVWGTSGGDDNIVWGTGFGDDNIVWGTQCGGGDCGDNIIWGTSDDDNIVWGTSDGDNIVWGTADGDDNIVWGTSDNDNIVWGTSDGGDNIVWGTASGLDNIVWGTNSFDDNIVWGTALSDDNIIWGTGFTFGPIGLKVPANPDYKWFLNPVNDVNWMRIMFGDLLPNLQSSAR